MSAQGDQDAAALDRVLTRVALTDDANLESVLSKLLPLVLAKLNEPTPAVQKAVLSILSHVNKRLKALPDIQLPLEPLVQMFNDPTTGVMARNFALVYIEQAAGRAPAEQLFAQLDALVQGIATRPGQHQDILLRLAVKAVENMAKQGNAFALGTEQEFASKYKFMNNEDPQSRADRKVFMRFASRAMLYQVPSAPRVVTALQQAQAAAAVLASRLQGAVAMDVDLGTGQDASAGAGADGSPANTPPAGLSFHDVAAVEGKSLTDGAALQRRKLGLLNFTAAAGVDPTEVLTLYLAAACDPNDVVNKRGDELLKKRCMVDTIKPAVDMESREVMEPLFVLFLGTLDDPTVPEEHRRAPVNPTLRNKLLSMFCRSAAAANCFPLTMTTITTCLYGAGTTPRTRQQGMEFAVWVFKHADPDQLAPAAPTILESCLSLLGTGEDSSAAGSGMDTTALTMRSFTYQAVGHLAQRQPKAVQGRTDVAVRFFTGLGLEPPGVRAAVQEAISALATAFTGCWGSTADEILQLLSTSLNHPQEAVRAAALQWAVRLFPFDNIPARYLCIMGAADARFQIADSALAGLLPSKFKTVLAITGTGSNGSAAASTEPQYPYLSDVIEYLSQHHTSLRTPVEEGRTLTMPAKSYTAAIEFTEGCWKQEESKGAVHEDLVVRYLVFLENALVREAPSDLHSAALAAMLLVAAAHKAVFAKAYCHRSSLFIRLLSHTDGAARDASARMMGMLCSDLPAVTTSHLLQSLVATLGSTRGGEGKKARFEEADGAAAALGYITAHCVGTGTGRDTSGEAAVPAVDVTAALTELKVQAQEAGDPALKATSVLALGHAALGLVLGHPSSTGYKVINVEFIDGCVPIAAALVADKEAKVAKKGVKALGFFCLAVQGAAAGDGAADAEEAASKVVGPAVEELLKLKGCKSEDVLFAAGEALSFAFGGVEVSAEDILQTNYQSLSNWEEQRQQRASAPAANVAPTDMHVETNPAPPATSTIQSQMLDVLLLGTTPLVSSTRPEERRAGATWLVSLLTFVRQSTHLRVLLPLLPDIQDALCTLLADSDELTQEISSKGLSACYELADADTRQALVDSLIGTLSGGAAGAKKRTRAGDVTADTKVFEPGALGTVPGGGNITTYKEICALANDVGQPDLVYRFMQLANHQAALQASRGAAFGFASIAKLAGEQLTPHVHKLVPRLYRSLYDPQPKVRDAMKHIWSALFPDPHITLTEHFSAVAAALINDTGSNQWRVRESAALALADLLQGRKWEALAPHFGGLWVAVFRVMDDVKETVRQAGLALARAVRGLTLRLADKESTPAAQGRAAVAAALPVLLDKGLPSRVPEVQGLAVETTAKLVAAAGPEVLKPHLTILVPAMLESLSGLEDARLNYVEQHAERIGLDMGRLENARVSASHGGPVGSTLDACARCMDGTALVELTPKLTALIRRGVGLNTRAGVGRFVTQVARRLGPDTKAAAPPLMRALREQCKTESSTTVRKTFATTHAVLAKHADSGKVDKVVEAWIDTTRGEEDDPAGVAVAGLMLKSLAREAPDVFTRHAPALAPIAYLLQYDSTEEVASVWGEVWEESSSSTGAGLRLHINNVVELIVGNLKSAQWGRKKAAALAAQRVASEAGDALGGATAQGLMQALLQEAPGRIWEGKESVLGAVGALCKSSAGALQQEGMDLGDKAVEVLVDAASKKKSIYRKAGLEQLEIALTAFKLERYYTQVQPLANELCDSFIAAVTGPARMDTDDTPSDSGPSKPAQPAPGSEQETSAPEYSKIPVTEAIACLVAAYEGCTPDASSQHTSQVATTIAAVLDVAPKPPMQLALAKSGIRFAKKWSEAGGPAPTPHHTQALIKLVHVGVRFAGDAKAAQLREAAVEMVGVVLPGCWLALGDEEKVKAKEAVNEVMQREKLPSLKGQIESIITRLS